MIESSCQPANGLLGHIWEIVCIRLVSLFFVNNVWPQTIFAERERWGVQLKAAYQLTAEVTESTAIKAKEQFPFRCILFTSV